MTIKKRGDLGFLGLNKPVEFGGQGLDYSFALMMAEELGAIRCDGVPMAIGVQTDMATPALARFGSDEVRREFLAPAIAGDAVACIGVSEPGAGSDVASIRTSARSDGGDYAINGGKMWITNREYASGPTPLTGSTILSANTRIRPKSSSAPQAANRAVCELNSPWQFKAGATTQRKFGSAIGDIVMIGMGEMPAMSQK